MKNQLFETISTKLAQQALHNQTIEEFKQRFLHGLKEKPDDYVFVTECDGIKGLITWAYTEEIAKNAGSDKQSIPFRDYLLEQRLLKEIKQKFLVLSGPSSFYYVFEKKQDLKE